jgi:hypothetical protein
MIDIQETKLETHGGYHGEAQVDPSECFYGGLHMILECRDTKLWSTVGCIIIMSRPWSAKPTHSQTKRIT